MAPQQNTRCTQYRVDRALLPRARGGHVGKPVKLRAGKAMKSARSMTTRPARAARSCPSSGRTARRRSRRSCCCCTSVARKRGRTRSSTARRNRADQAAILFSLAAKIVRLSGELSDVVVIRDTAKHLYCPELGTLYKALSAEASTAYGPLARLYRP